MRCDDLTNVVLEGDKIFFIRECQNNRDQLEVLRRLEACLFPEPIQYTYDANFASCQTFCSKIFSANLLEMLNPEAVFDQSKRKNVAKWLLSSDDDWQELTREMERRFEGISTANLPPDGAGLINIYPDSSVLLRCLQLPMDWNYS